jgi:rRNA maturation RNase YbeY
MLANLVEAFLRLKRIAKKEVSIVLVGDRKIQELNYKYRGSNQTTDVLSFYETKEDKGFAPDDFLGEIIINFPQIKRQAKNYNNSVKSELKFVLVHGLLHLLGVRDYTKKEKEKMDKSTKVILKQLEKEKI